MPRRDTRAWLHGAFRRGEDILPAPRCAGVGVLTCKGIRHVHVAIALVQVVFVQKLDCDAMLLPRLEQLRQHGDAVV